MAQIGHLEDSQGCSLSVQPRSGLRSCTQFHHRHLHYYSQGGGCQRAPVHPLWNTPRKLQKLGAGTLVGRSRRLRPPPPGTHIHETEPLLSVGSHSYPQTHETWGELTSQNKAIDAFNIHQEWEPYDLTWVTPRRTESLHLSSSGVDVLFCSNPGKAQCQPMDSRIVTATKWLLLNLKQKEKKSWILGKFSELRKVLLPSAFLKCRQFISYLFLFIHF